MRKNIFIYDSPCPWISTTATYKYKWIKKIRSRNVLFWVKSFIQYKTRFILGNGIVFIRVLNNKNEMYGSLWSHYSHFSHPIVWP